MRSFLRGLSRHVVLVGMSLVLVVLVAGVVTACGMAGQVGDGGTVSTTESPAPTDPSATTTTVVPEPTSSTEMGEVPTTVTTAMTETTATTETEDQIRIRVYFSQGEKISVTSRMIPRTQQVGAAAVRALLEGPDAAEQDAGMVSNIPDGTAFLGLSIDGDGVATVDLSREYGSGGGSLSMMMRLAEVVFTLTQFPTVEGVSFKLDGEAIDVLGGEGIIIDHPMTRADYEDLSPAILVESPTWGETVTSPMRITGTANVFEAVFRVNIVDWDGLIIADKVVMASSGTGTRGTFDVSVPFPVDHPGLGALIVFAESPKDGSQIDVVEIPLELQD